MNLNKLIQVGALPKIIANTFDGAFVILMITLDLVLVRMVRPDTVIPLMFNLLYKVNNVAITEPEISNFLVKL